MASILSPYASNQYTIKNTFTFVKELNNFTSNSSYLTSFDVSSLFTNIPLDETIDIALDYAYKDTNSIRGLTRADLKKLLQIATGETNFMFNGKIYDQIDGVAMGSPLTPILANIFIRRFEENAIQNYTGQMPSLYRRYVDDSFLIFRDKTHVLPFSTT